MCIVIGMFFLVHLLLGLVLEYLCCRLPRRRIWRALPPVLGVVLTVLVGVDRWSLWESETVSPVTQLLIFPGVPGTAPCWAAGWASAGLSETKKGGRRTISCSASLLAKTILNALRYALGIFSGKAIYNFGTPERLRTLRRSIFTVKASAPAGLACCAD